MGGPHNEHNYQISKSYIWVTQANITSCCNFNHHLTDSSKSGAGSPPLTRFFGSEKICVKKNHAMGGVF